MGPHNISDSDSKKPFCPGSGILGRAGPPMRYGAIPTEPCLGHQDLGANTRNSLALALGSGATVSALPSHCVGRTMSLGDIRR